VVLPRPKSMLIQWHVTERCNWHCRHCYQDACPNPDELSYEEMVRVLHQYLSLITQWKLPRTQTRINLTGGEPFVRKDFVTFLGEISRHTAAFQWGILSNGSYLTPDLATTLKSYGISTYQLSLEGLESYNDSIRGEGSYQKVLSAIRILVNAGIRTHVSLTLTRKNINDVPRLCEILSSLGAARINTRRLVPLGTGSTLEEGMIEPLDLRAYYQMVKRLNEEYRPRNFSIVTGCESAIINSDPTCAGRLKHSCGIHAAKILVIMPNGDVYPCRRLPLTIGNVRTSTLFKIWHNSDLNWRMRNINNEHPFCKKCANYVGCYGGAKCINYAYYGKIQVPDVQCWQYTEKLLPKDFFSEYEEPDSSDVVFGHELCDRPA
jgi:radical SAM protein with 4Fe4S-binding SPASM domain